MMVDWKEILKDYMWVDMKALTKVEKLDKLRAEKMVDKKAEPTVITMESNLELSKAATMAAMMGIWKEN